MVVILLIRTVSGNLSIAVYASENVWLFPPLIYLGGDICLCVIYKTKRHSVFLGKFYSWTMLSNVLLVIRGDPNLILAHSLDQYSFFLKTESSLKFNIDTLYPTTPSAWTLAKKCVCTMDIFLSGNLYCSWESRSSLGLYLEPNKGQNLCFTSTHQFDYLKALWKITIKI